MDIHSAELYVNSQNICIKSLINNQLICENSNFLMIHCNLKALGQNVNGV
jgi:hypothetical protein